MAKKATISGEAALEAAQDAVCHAWEKTNAKRRVKLARKALAISPLCADAYAPNSGPTVHRYRSARVGGSPTEPFTRLDASV